MYLPTIFEVVSFARVSKYRILSSSFRLLKTTSCVERREWSSFLMLSYPGQYINSSSAARPLYSLYCRLDMFFLLLGLVHLYFRISQSVFASYEPPDAILIVIVVVSELENTRFTVARTL